LGSIGDGGEMIVAGGWRSCRRGGGVGDEGDELIGDVGDMSGQRVDCQAVGEEDMGIGYSATVSASFRTSIC